MIAGNGDTSHGPIITIDGKKAQTYLIQLIDDASRLIVGYQFFLRDNALNFQLVLKQAIKTYGVPKRLFVDNGTPYVEEKTVTMDATVRIAGRDFEVNQKYIKQRILIKYSPDDLSFVYVFNNKDNTLKKAYPVDKIANSKIKRKNFSYEGS